MSQQIKLSDILISNNPRCVLNEEAVTDYVDRAESGSEFPAIDVYAESLESPEVYWLADGLHRNCAACRLERKTIAANVFKGGKREALEHALRSNWDHGVRRTAADKRRCVELALADDVWKSWSDQRVADLCGVSRSLVGDVRKVVDEREAAKAKLATTPVETKTEPEKRVGKDGRKRPTKRKAPSVQLAEKQVEPTPDASPASQTTKPQAVTFDVPAISKKPRKSGREKMPAKERRLGEKLFGQLWRWLQKHNATAEPAVDEATKAILAWIRES